MSFPPPDNVKLAPFLRWALDLLLVERRCLVRVIATLALALDKAT